MTTKILILMLVLCSDLPKTISVEEAFEFSQNDKTESIPNGNETDLSNVSTTCHLKINQSSQKKILKLIHRKEKNAIELIVLIQSFNNTLNRSRVLTGIKWANKMGRTLISLIAQAENMPAMVLSSYTSTLTVGVDNVDIVVSEMTKGCLLFSGGNASNIVFNFLLHQLYVHDNGDDSDYQLCSINTGSDDTKYNCCSLLGRERIPICSDYSSILMESSNNLFAGAILLFVFFLFPLIVEHLSDFQNERIQYKISDSPMSLSSIFHKIFIEGHGPVKSPGRRLVVTIIVLVTILPDWKFYLLSLYIPLYGWALLFPFVDAHNFNDWEAHDSRVAAATRLSFFALNGNPVEIIALPFNLKFLWNEVNRRPFFRRHLKLNLNSATSDQLSTTSSGISERSSLLTQVELRQQPRNSPRQIVRYLMDLHKYCLSIIVLLILYLLIALPILCLLVLYTLFYIRYMIKLINRTNTRPVLKQANMILGVVTLMILLYSFFKCFVLAFYYIAGLYLNAGFYSTYFVPLSIILFYSWSNWKSSVEEKYLELNTKIYKVCKEIINHPVQVTHAEEAPSETSDHSIETDSNDSFHTSTSPAVIKRFKMKLDENGEPVIPKPLYDIVRETFLPYHKILVPYFEGVIFVVICAYFLFIFMSLAQASGVSSSVQLISTMAATSLPFLFDIIWKKNSDRQKAANNLALKSKLKHVLLVCSSNDATGEIIVEFTGAIPTDPFGNHVS